MQADLGWGGEVGRVLDMPVVVHNAPHDNHGVVRLGAGEGLAPRQQHIQQHAQAPPVHAGVVAVRQHILWRHVAWRPAEGVCSFAAF